MLPVATTIEEVREAVAKARAEGKSIGLVPTMGALHQGHVRLIEQCCAETEFVVVSIYVNPTQFGPGEDLARYPRNLEQDRALSARAGSDLIFAPTDAVMYPAGALGTYVEVPGLSEVLEGATRPGHFRGVATVVLKLFEIVAPDLALFGQKDYQQQLVLRRMAADLDLRVAIRTVSTVREPDGLAMSSRNRYLAPAERRAATVLFRALERARRLVRDGVRSGDSVRQILRETIESELLARLDYAAVADADTLASVNELEPGRGAVALLAVRIGATRLIDNILLTD